MAPFSQHAASCSGALLLAVLAPLGLIVDASEQITSLDQLVAQLNTGSNKKVAFLAQANYDSVHNVLPSSVEVVICDGQDHYGVTCNSVSDMIDRIQDQSVLSGLISGLPEADQAPLLNTFSSTLVSTRAMFMAPLQSADFLHGTTVAASSSYDLSLAVDAAIVALQRTGKDEEIRVANQPFEFMAVHTCKGEDSSAFVVPNAAAATGLLRTALDTRVLKIGALGPYDWGGNDGNYLLSPPAGFYPDWLTEFCAQFNELEGSDGVKYNANGIITCERVWKTSSAGVFEDLFEGASHVTEPYFVVDGFYSGTRETCSSDSDCRPASATLVAGGQEQCVDTNADSTKECTHPSSPRTRHFRISCTTLGVDSTFMTKKQPAANTGTVMMEKDGLSTGAIVAIVLLTISMVIVAAFLCIVIRKEMKGQPLFNPLVEKSPQPAGGGQTYGNGNGV